MLGELKHGLPGSHETLLMKVLGNNMVMQDMAVGPQGKNLMDHQV